MIGLVMIDSEGERSSCHLRTGGTKKEVDRLTLSGMAEGREMS